MRVLTHFSYNCLICAYIMEIFAIRSAFIV